MNPFGGLDYFLLLLLLSLLHPMYYFPSATVRSPKQYSPVDFCTVLSDRSLPVSVLPEISLHRSTVHSALNPQQEHITLQLQILLLILLLLPKSRQQPLS